MHKKLLDDGDFPFDVYGYKITTVDSFSDAVKGTETKL